MNKDIEHLSLLKVFHYVVGGISCLTACIPLLHVAIGYLIATNQLPHEGEGNQIPNQFGWIFVALGVLAFLLGQMFSICIIFSGRYIQHRKNYMYSFIISCISCMFVPFGTALGICSIIVLSRDSVKKLYEESKAPHPINNLAQ
ncbi:MAG: hypothetical protein NE330_17680 [Lentisphaeraceae bacterium]|nr:hypothetical protein [Lentisphaeraceae bacterium]